MRFEGLDLNLLVALDAILDERSVKGASQRLHLSQPAMSSAVNRLRRYFNDEIYTVSQRKLVPTPLAQSLEGPTRDILLRIRANLISTPKFEPQHSKRRFRMVVSDYATTVLMTRVMRRVYKAAPHISIEFLPFNDRIGDQLQRGDVDLVILPDTILVDGHPHQSLFGDEFCCVAWSGNRKIGRSVSLNRYLELGHVTAQFGPSPGSISFEEEALEKLGYKRRVELIAPNFTTMAIMLIGTDRVATMHSRLASVLTRHFPLKLLRPPFRISGFRECLQWPALFHLDPALSWFRQIITEISSEIDRTPANKMGFE
ncbi:LysR family transcriptional regulator [Bradyrhizobium stylosanthis]|uniref:LysR family nod box-dependent transcriptional activator n=1 Tax=Bradyrhizobium stylosanthis TaxID=1803665 RepID=A0A560DZ71_9BRAD|nr:LysR family transcriptional regulator [Bradyrhizobium stylosanthis]TWB02416.1 LysR family nod box-dependent transcriptional activator [Bradyrhizobium stylosanthis]